MFKKKLLLCTGAVSFLVLLCQQRTYSQSSDYLLKFSLSEADVRSTEFRKNQAASYKAPDIDKLVAHDIDPDERKKLLESVRKDLEARKQKRITDLQETAPVLKYSGVVGKRDGIYLFQIRAEDSNGNANSTRVSPKPGSEYVMLYNQKSDETVSITRLPRSAADAWIDRGLDTRKMPFIVLASPDSPLIDRSNGPDKLMVPVVGGQAVGEPGVKAEVIYRPVSVKRENGSVVFDILDGNSVDERWNFLLQNTRDGVSTIPREVVYTEFRAASTPQHKRVSSQYISRTISLAEGGNVSDNNMLFDASHWLKNGDAIYDNRSAPRQKEMYDVKIGTIGSKKPETSSKFAAFVFVAPLLILVLWYFARSKSVRNQ